MTRPSVAEYMAALFEPLVEAAGRPDWANQLKTAPLPKERQISQYRRLAKINEFGGVPLPLVSDSFIYRFRHDEGWYLCVETENLTSDGKDRLNSWAASNQLIQQEGVEEAAFLFLAYNAKDYFRPKSIHLSRKAADDILGITDQDYGGHNIYEVQRWYRDITVFGIPEDNVFRSVTGYGIAASLASAVVEFRSPLVSPPLASAIAQLAQLPNVNPENLFFALTSTHWKYIVVEIYKCLEAAFYLPWVKSLRDALGHQMSALSMAQQCKASLRWRENERESLYALFSLLPEACVKTPAIKATVTFSDLLGEKTTTSVYAERVYRIRNQIVHQFDYEGRVPLKIPTSVWPVLALYLCEIVRFLYSTYAADLDYTFALNETDATFASADDARNSGGNSGNI